MNLPAKFTSLFFVSMTVCVIGATPPASNDAPIVGQSKDAPITTSTRLGIKFSPPNNDDTNAATAPQTVVDPLFTDASLPFTILKPYLVTTPRVKLTEKDVLTDKARLALAKKTQLTPLYQVTFGPLSQLGAYYFDWLSIFGGWHPNDVEAMILYRQEEDLRRKMEMNSLIKLETLYAPKDEKPLQQLRLNPDSPKQGLLILSPR